MPRPTPASRKQSSVREYEEGGLRVVETDLSDGTTRIERFSPDGPGIGALIEEWGVWNTSTDDDDPYLILHRHDGPARTVRDRDGSGWTEEFFSNGFVRSIIRGAPSIIHRSKNGKALSATWVRQDSEGFYYPSDRPSYVEYREDGTTATEVWVQTPGPCSPDELIPEGRYDGPSTIRYDNNGRIISQEWRIGGDLIRDDGGPTIEEFYPTGVIKERVWISYGIERDYQYGPYRERYNQEGNLVSAEFASYTKDGSVPFTNKDAERTYVSMINNGMPRDWAMIAFTASLEVRDAG